MDLTIGVRLAQSYPILKSSLKFVWSLFSPEYALSFSFLLLVFRVDLQSVVVWMSRAFFLETGVMSEDLVTAMGL